MIPPKLVVGLGKHLLGKRSLYTKTLKNTLEPFSKEDITEFMGHFPAIVEDLTGDETYCDIDAARKRFAYCLEYNVPNGRRVRGLTTIITYKHFAAPEELTPDNIRLANILGWTTELLQGAIIMFDDIMDSSYNRRNSLCWFRRADVGMAAISDAIALEHSLFYLLMKYISEHPNFCKIIQHFHDVIFRTAVGQSMDSRRYSPDEINMETFKAIAKYKTSYYTFYFPVILGLYFSQKFTDELYKEMVPILMEMGEYFQIQNDLNDCFGNVLETGKVGTDIEQSKCTWLSAMALQQATHEQREIMEKHYGKQEIVSIQAVRNLYKDLNLVSQFYEFQERHFKTLCKSVDKLEEPQRSLLQKLLSKLYKRECQSYINNSNKSLHVASYH